jgi:hypothetical protein
MTARSPAQNLAMLLGGVFLLVGIAGFIPGITQDYDELTNFSGEGAELLGIFGINIIENIVHLAFGLVGLAMARTPTGARTFLLGGGVVYLVIWIYGLLIDLDGDANFIGVNDAGNWLHLALGVAMIVGGIVTTRGRMTTTTPPPPPPA